ncbi:MAG: hypothetical protein GY842_25075 [bacterium]|nr:hypothetical protein [bacterium]
MRLRIAPPPAGARAGGIACVVPAAGLRYCNDSPPPGGATPQRGPLGRCAGPTRPADSFVVASAGRAYFRVEELLRLSVLVEGLSEANAWRRVRNPPRSDGFRPLLFVLEVAAFNDANAFRDQIRPLAQDAPALHLVGFAADSRPVGDRSACTAAFED